MYVVDRTGVANAATLQKLNMLTGITGVTSGAADDIESTDLDAVTDKTFVKGLMGPAPIPVPFNLDPKDLGHQFLYEMQALGDLVDCYVGLSDASTAPTLTGTDPAKVLVPPAARTGFTFKAFISEVAIDIATNEIVRGTLTLRRSGPVTPFWKP